MYNYNYLECHHGYDLLNLIGIPELYSEYICEASKLTSGIPEMQNSYDQWRSLSAYLMRYDADIQSHQLLTQMLYTPREREIKFISLFGDRGHRGPYSTYKPCNHNLYIGIIIFPHIDNQQSTGDN